MARPVSAATKLNAMYKAILADKGTKLPLSLYRFALEWALVTVNRGQTPYEHEAKECLEQNGKGWRKCHARFGSSLADWIECGMKKYGKKLGNCLTERQLFSAQKMTPMYWRQFGPTLPLMLSRYQEVYGSVSQNVVNEAELLSLPCPDDDDEAEIVEVTPEVTPEAMRMPPATREIICSNCGSISLVKYADRCNECGERYLASLQYIGYIFCSDIESTTLVVWA